MKKIKCKNPDCNEKMKFDRFWDTRQNREGYYCDKCGHYRILSIIEMIEKRSKEIAKGLQQKKELRRKNDKHNR